jgi:hypothetical protein
MPEHPECDRLVAVADDSHKLGEFLDWLNSQGFHLSGWQTHQVCDLLTAGRPAGVRHCEGGQLVDKEGRSVGQCERCDGTGLVELRHPRLDLAQVPYEQLLADYFDIDLQKVEEERRAILVGLSKELRT